MQIARRHKILIGSLAVLGLVGGSAYTLMNPPKATSEALVVLPQSVNSGSATSTDANGNTVFPGAATQVVIAGSDPVLNAALRQINPPMSLRELRLSVQVTSVAGTVIAIDGKSTSAAQAVEIANAVANAYVAYVSSPASPVGRLSVRVLQPGAYPTGESLLQRLLPFALLGALAGALIGFITALALGRNARRLREKDAIADSLGVPVLAAIPVSRPSDANAWTKLLDEYEPSVVHAWQLRKMLDQLGIADSRPTNEPGRASSLAVLSLAADKKALALGPQLAAFAASLGIRTILVAGQQQDAAAAATLYTACAVPPHAAPRRRRPLRTLAADDGRAIEPAGAELIVVVAVIDAKEPQMPDIMHTGLTILGVSAGAATAEELAKVATVAAADKRDLTGIVVADPDPGDRSTGRVPQLGRIQRRMPSRVTGIPTESRR
jgi:capsular polysaccharide biosynthesis protein